MVGGLVEQQASGRMSRMRASATRIFQPPERAPTSPSIIAGEKPSPARISRARASRRVAPQLVEARLHVAEAVHQLVQLVRPRRVGQGVLQLVPARRPPPPPDRRRPWSRPPPTGPAISPTSWPKWPMVTPRSMETWPSSGSSSRVMRRKSVDLPAPLGPTSPTFSPRVIVAEASRKRIWCPCCLAMASRRIKGAPCSTKLPEVRRLAGPCGPEPGAGSRVRGVACSSGDGQLPAANRDGARWGCRAASRIGR